MPSVTTQKQVDARCRHTSHQITGGRLQRARPLKQNHIVHGTVRTVTHSTRETGWRAERSTTPKETGGRLQRARPMLALIVASVIRETGRRASAQPHQEKQAAAFSARAFAMSMLAPGRPASRENGSARGALNHTKRNRLPPLACTPEQQKHASARGAQHHKRNTRQVSPHKREL